jgi:hypothetical protein
LPMLAAEAAAAAVSSPSSFSRPARLMSPVAVSACTGPHISSIMTSARSSSRRAPARSPSSLSKLARLLRLRARLRCFGPNTVSWMATARSRNRRAPAKSPWRWSTRPCGGRGLFRDALARTSSPRCRAALQQPPRAFKVLLILQ